MDSIIRYKYLTTAPAYSSTIPFDLALYSPPWPSNWRRRTSTFDPGQSANLSERELVSLAVSSPRKDLRALATALRREILSDHDGEGAEKDLKQFQEAVVPLAAR